MKRLVNTVVVNGEVRDALLVELDFNGFNTMILLIDYGSCLSKIDLDAPSFEREGIEEDYISLIKRFNTRGGGIQ